VSKKSKTPIQFQQPENTPRRQHTKPSSKKERSRNARAKALAENERDRQKTPSNLHFLSLSVCLARDDEEEEELEEEKNISDKKGGFERKRNVTHHHHHLLIILSPFNASVKSTIDPVYITDK
jgi:hypothetical protein